MFSSSDIKPLFEMADAAYANPPPHKVNGFYHCQNIPIGARRIIRKKTKRLLL